MSQATQISHLTQMVRANVYHSYLSNINADYGYLTQLDKLVENGGYASHGTLEEMELARTIDELRELADHIEKTRDKLMANIELRSVA